MKELTLPDVCEAAARAGINERCAGAYLHDIRGTMQALYSSLELLGRQARSGGAHPRIEQGWALARRAMEHHETSMLDAFRALTLQPDKAGPVEIAALLGEVAHFLRNDAAAKDVRIQVAAAGEIRVTADRATLKSLLLGLLLAALDALPDGAELPVSIDRVGHEAVIRVGSHAGCAPLPLDAPLRRAGGRIPAPDLALLFADRFLNAQGGRLEIDPETPPHGALRVYYPTVA